MGIEKEIADFAVGDEIEGFYLMKEAYQKTTSTGKPFFCGFVSDRTGSFDFKIWDYTGPLTPADVGKVIKLRGTVSEYKGNLQLVVSRVRLASETDLYDRKRLVPAAPIDAEKSLDEIRQILSTLKDPDYRSVGETMLKRHEQAFLSIPAAKSVHHSFLSGLLMHTYSMLKAADFMAGLYAGIVNRDLLIVGTLLHDFAKENEFSFSELGLVTEYSVKGQLIGHLVMGAEEVGKTADELGIPAEKKLLLQHMILSHHGEPEFGAAVRPLCAEAELLSYIDLIDSRMEIYSETLPNIPEGEFSQKIFALDHRVYHHK